MCSTFHSPGAIITVLIKGVDYFFLLLWVPSCLDFGGVSEPLRGPGDSFAEPTLKIPLLTRFSPVLPASGCTRKVTRPPAGPGSGEGAEEFTSRAWNPEHRRVEPRPASDPTYSFPPPRPAPAYLLLARVPPRPASGLPPKPRPLRTDPPAPCWLASRPVPPPDTVTSWLPYALEGGSLGPGGSGAELRCRLLLLALPAALPGLSPLRSREVGGGNREPWL